MANTLVLRFLILIVSLVCGVAVLVVLNMLLDDKMARVLLGAKPVSKGVSEPLIFSIQHITWLIFFVGLGELWVRLQWARDEAGQLRKDYMGSDLDRILGRSELGNIYMALRKAPQSLFLPRLLGRTIAQFQANRSIGQANSLLNSSIELFMHEIELRYSLIRYIVWIIPTVGFMGTVVGISNAIGLAGVMDPTNPDLLKETTKELAVAFDTTFLSLVLSGIFVFLVQLVEGLEESVLNQSGQYCIDHLINRLYVTENRKIN